MNLVISRSTPIDKTFTCMSFYTLYKRSIAFDARKLKVSKANGMKTMLILGNTFSHVCHFTWTGFESCLFPSKTSSAQSHQWKNPSQVYTCMFPSYPLVHQNICWSKCRFPFPWVSQEIHIRLFLHKYPRHAKIYQIIHFKQSHVDIWILEAPYHEWRVSQMYPSTLCGKQSKSH